MYPRVHHFRITGSLSEPALPLSVALLWGNITLFILQERKFISENGKQGLKPCTETKRNSCVVCEKLWRIKDGCKFFVTTSPCVPPTFPRWNLFPLPLNMGGSGPAELVESLGGGGVPLRV